MELKYVCMMLYKNLVYLLVDNVLCPIALFEGLQINVSQTKVQNDKYAPSLYHLPYI